MGSTTATVELELKEIQFTPFRAEVSDSKFTSTKAAYSAPQQLESTTPTELPAPSTAVSTARRWNSPKANRYRIFAVFYAFVVVGLNDAAYGALIPYLEKYYNLKYTIVSLIFLSPFVGYTLAAFSVSTIHMKLGQRGIAVMAPLCHMIPYIIVSFHPPIPC